MPIVTDCPGCGKRLRVADEHAGKTARCPGCRTTYVVPAESAAEPPASATSSPQSPSAPGASHSPGTADLPEAAASPPPHDFSSGPASSSGPAPFTPAPRSQPRDGWSVRTEDGEVYGPVPHAELVEWAEEGRITASCQIMKAGEETRGWRPASDMFPSLGSPAGAAAAAGTPFQPSGRNRPLNYPRPTAATGSLEPHRGGVVLTYGVLSTVFCFCPIFSILAWIMGYYDLSQIDAGRMDPRGRGMTQAGMVLGILMAVFQGLVLLVFILND